MKVTLLHGSGPRDVQEQVLDVPEGTTVRQALTLAGWIRRFPETATDASALSVWGRKAGGDQVLREGDRVEVCRDLRVDPKVARRERFVAQGSRGSGLFASRRPGSKAGY
ncbi:MAG: RnfH family protein [Burkholderiaceae bacterium]